MTRFLSKHQCSACNQHIVYDSDERTLTCQCGTFHCQYINPDEFNPIPLDKLQKTIQLPDAETG